MFKTADINISIKDRIENCKLLARHLGGPDRLVKRMEQLETEPVFLGWSLEQLTGVEKHGSHPMTRLLIKNETLLGLQDSETKEQQTMTTTDSQVEWRITVRQHK